MYIMMQQEKPDDYVIGTGEAHSVKEFCEKAFACIGVHLAYSLLYDNINVIDGKERD